MWPGHSREAMWLEQSEHVGEWKEVETEGARGGGGQSMCGWWPITRTFTFALSDMGAIGGFEQRNALINEGFGRIALAASGE